MRFRLPLARPPAARLTGGLRSCPESLPRYLPPLPWRGARAASQRWPDARSKAKVHSPPARRARNALAPGVPPPCSQGALGRAGQPHRLAPAPALAGRSLELVPGALVREQPQPPRDHVAPRASRMPRPGRCACRALASRGSVARTAAAGSQRLAAGASRPAKLRPTRLAQSTSPSARPAPRPASCPACPLTPTRPRLPPPPPNLAPRPPPTVPRSH